ncbi:alpha-glucuronidase [Tuanshanicoccus lijuaniae]|uniref:alpha-glucuronidase n=1 Tax=Aerococcaceae bacterium zg-1292 TaxID=2774330 RepID=UPI001BD8D2B9|nr:alpha-glucuronidase [Aerococcaceae bacterium zg-A91]MBS4457143.1 alpha-glucuronidase [Aerococcaceae bacterium zg-BR33]
MDKAWLNKKIKGYNSYFLEVKDEIANQIRKEIEYLFDDCKENNIYDSSDLLLKLEQNNLNSNEGFIIKRENKKIVISANHTKGLLYGIYTLYRKEILNENIEDYFEFIPNQSFRMINHWDNMDGTIERGYAGESIFYCNNDFRRDFKLVEEYARLLASVGINALSINNVNVHRTETELISDRFLPELVILNQIFNRFGIKMFLAINFASPKIIGQLDTADPLNAEVISFWKEKIEKIYTYMPSFGGFVIKADSEGEPGPFAYNRTHVEGANMFGNLLKPFGGVCIWRCFVYNSKQDWRDRSTDRARAAYDHFLPYDGKFADNVILQIKLGPLDFQVKEPVSPLFGALKNTNHILEFQLTQEYTGQQKAIYYQVPVWKEVLDFDTHHENKENFVKNTIRENSINSCYSGLCAVGVVGTDNNWTGHKLMQSNLYAYGRLAWENDLTSEIIAREWIKLTFNLQKQLEDSLLEILLTSRETYQLYNAPNGVGFMCRPNHHYGPDIDGYEFDRWGTYHFADRDGVGVNRSTTGTGFTGQYADKNFNIYNNVHNCPDDLLLWFHHVPYTHKLQNGKTLIQDIYDNHFEGVERVEAYIKKWNLFEGFVEPDDFENVRERLLEQYRVSIEWRDQINTYFYRKSGISDKYNRKIYK